MSQEEEVHLMGDTEEAFERAKNQMTYATNELKRQLGVTQKRVETLEAELAELKHTYTEKLTTLQESTEAASEWEAIAHYREDALGHWRTTTTLGQKYIQDYFLDLARELVAPLYEAQCEHIRNWFFTHIEPKLLAKHKSEIEDLIKQFLVDHYSSGTFSEEQALPPPEED